MALLRHVPLWLKIVYTGFMLVLVPVYWHFYGPTNFCYFCDIALILTLVGIWKENSLLISMSAVGILVPQLVWVVDFLAGLLGFRLTGMTAYMQDPNRSLFLRGISLFHGWLPFLLTYLVARVGYDRRALPAWTALAYALILFCFFVLPPAGAHPGLTPVNINYVWGLSDEAPQALMPAWVWFGGMFFAMPLFFYFPAHLLLQRIGRAHQPRRRP